MKRAKKVLVFGANGFIGQHLVERILKETNWQIIANDLNDKSIRKHRKDPRFKFYKGDIRNVSLITKLVRQADTVVPLAGIATPRTYIEDPLRVYEIDFEANLVIVRLCAKYKKRIIWPSTSEVYGMSTDTQFHPETSNLVMGPIHKMRWIYAAGKQLMDRVVAAYGQQHGLDYTIFRPFNWIGFGQDNIHDMSGTPRVLTQFLGNILRGKDIELVDGGNNRRSFTHIDDCTDALIKMVENKKGIASGKIYNIGNPRNNHSIRELAELALKVAPSYRFFRDKAKKVSVTSVTSKKHYGEGYQDMINRTPYIKNTMKDLGWKPRVSLKEALKRTFAAYVEELAKEA